MLGRLLAAPTRPKLGLERMRALLSGLGDPQHRFASLHIAGTKGKGSTAAFAAAMCQAAGMKVGTTTSPHLSCARERITLDGAMISEERFVALAGRVSQAASMLSEPPSFFEQMVAMAFCAFADDAVDVAVVEVGLGGRLDATNVLLPRACAITVLGLDHTDWLGPTLTHIAREKAGIIKSGVPCFTVAQQAPAARVLAERAHEVDAPLLVVNERRDLPISLHGIHQRQNASLAAALVGAVGVTDAAIVAGARNAFVAGRYETVRTAPRVILDGAHNATAAHALGEALRADAGLAGRDLALVVGMTAGHDARAFAESLGVLPIRRVICVPTRSPRTQHPRAVAAGFAQLGPPVTAAGLADALQLASDGPMAVTGSLYLVGEARALLLNAPSDPMLPLF
jgi:dihydrofolate synthase/folylpolyglutamate synthase